MANPDRPRGAEPKGDPIRVNEYVAGAQVRPGDIVSMQADGKVDPYVAGSGIKPLGVCLSNAADGENCQVSDDPQQLYVIQADGSDVDAQTDIGLNYEVVATASNSSFKISRHELDSDTGAVTTTLPLRLVAIENRPDNALGAQVDCIVQLNNQQLNELDGL